MIIRLDFDNDCIKIGSWDAFSKDRDEHIMNYDFSNKEMIKIKPLLCEIINSIKADPDDDILIDKQDDGQITVIEDY